MQLQKARVAATHSCGKYKITNSKSRKESKYILVYIYIYCNVSVYNVVVIIVVPQCKFANSRMPTTVFCVKDARRALLVSSNSRVHVLVQWLQFPRSSNAFNNNKNKFKKFIKFPTLKVAVDIEKTKHTRKVLHKCTKSDQKWKKSTANTITTTTTTADCSWSARSNEIVKLTGNEKKLNQWIYVPILTHTNT